MSRSITSLLAVALLASGCASITNDPNVPVSLSMSDGSSAACELKNKRGNWSASVPATVMVRRSDDVLQYTCSTADGRRAVGSIPSSMGAKIVASAVFIDFGITDAITDLHREYPASFVIPLRKEGEEGEAEELVSAGQDD
ncbi:MAG: hypothetical protein R3E54_03540 [Halioglobus sp.]